jgi:hypothetical protein
MDAAITELLSFSEYALDQHKNSDKHSNQYLRTSLHKAYYAAYNTCQPIASKFPEPTKKSGVHQTVINTFKQAATNYNPEQKGQLRLLAQLLAQAKKSRTKADYKLLHPVIESETKEQLRVAKDIIELSKAIDDFVTLN